MAAKPVAAGNKRKATPSSKGRSDSKKARVEDAKAQAKAQASSDDSSDSDSEDGGVELNAGDEQKPFKKTDAGANGNAFDRSKSNCTALS